MTKVTNLKSYKTYKDTKESGQPIPTEEAATHDANVASLLEQVAKGEIFPCEPGFDQPWTQEEKEALDKALEVAWSKE